MGVVGKPSGVALSDIAAGLAVTTEQRDRGVAVVDATAGDLATRLAPFAGELPCSAAAAATLVDAYAAGRSVGDAARSAGLAPVTGAKTLHLLGEPVRVLGPTGRAVVRDWLAAELTRSEAIQLVGEAPTTFALGVFFETHDPIAGAPTAVEAALSPAGRPAVEKRDHLAATMSGPDELR